MSERRYVASFAASEAAIISASQDESATVGCFLLLQVMAALPYRKTCPEVECRVAQSESEKPVRGRLSIAQNALCRVLHVLRGTGHGAAEHAHSVGDVWTRLCRAVKQSPDQRLVRGAQRCVGR
eukprot:3662976-Pleurochrysis_carterae.AAC.1